jgi:hypothetical protein
MITDMSTSRQYDLIVLAHQANSIRHYKAYAGLIRGFHKVVPFAWRDPLPKPVGGHYAVTRSLVNGLERIGTQFAYRPPLEKAAARAAIVLAGVKDLQAAIEWRERGRCAVLLAGPNIVDAPLDHGGILLSPVIDRVVVASAKVRNIYLSIAPELANRIWVWPAGVDETYWNPDGPAPKKSVLIYNKKMPELTQELVAVLNAHGIAAEVISYSDKRGTKYRAHQYRSALNRSFACVMLTHGETQGLAAVEAWAMNVPTLAYRAATSDSTEVLPYLTDQTGSYWSTSQELCHLLQRIDLNSFSPRQWVLANMTDTICASKLTVLIRSFIDDASLDE